MNIFEDERLDAPGCICHLSQVQVGVIKILYIRKIEIGPSIPRVTASKKTLGTKLESPS